MDIDKTTTSEALHARTTRRRVSNTAVGGTDEEEQADHTKAADHRPTASVAILEHDQVDEHQPAGMGIDPQRKGHTVGPGHPPAATGQVRTPVATDCHTADAESDPGEASRGRSRAIPIIAANPTNRAIQYE